MKNLFIIVLVGITAFNCSSSDDSNDVGMNQILSGTVEGRMFMFESGKAFYATFGNNELVSINLTNEMVGCNDFIGDFNLRISADVPRSVGVFNNINIVTQDGNETPFNNLNQSVEITTFTETEISGKMKLTRKSSTIAPESIFEGTFVVPLCD